MYSSMIESMVMYPSVTAGLTLGKSLITSGHNLTLFCPNPVYLELAGSAPSELKLVAHENRSSVQIVEDLTHVEGMDFVIFPNLDFEPDKSRSEFGRLCRENFRYSLQNKIIISKDEAKSVYIPFIK